MRELNDGLINLDLSEHHIGVIGCGIAGCTTALMAADLGARVDLFEATSKILNEASDATPCRLGLGFHYMDISTAKLNLETSIKLVRYLKKAAHDSFQVAFSQPADSHIHNQGKIFYAIANNSLVSADEAMKIFNELRSHYVQLVESDSENKVFGEPADFYKVVDKNTFTGIIDLAKIDRVIETCETLFDWPRFKGYLINRISSHSRITLHLNAEVKSISRNDVLKIAIKISKYCSPMLFDTVVNASWGNVDHLNKSLGWLSGRNTINRVKCMAIIKLPSELFNTSILVGYGSFCSLSSRPGGIGYLTYEPATNVAQFYSQQEKHSLDEFMLTMTESGKREISKNIIDGASSYIPLLKKSQYISTRVGVVRTDEGKIDITVKDNHFNRNFEGVYPVMIGVIVNEARKHTYWCANAQQTLRLIVAQAAIRSEVFKLTSSIISDQSIQKFALSREDRDVFLRVLSVVFVFNFFNIFIDEKSLRYLNQHSNSEAHSYSLYFRNKNALHEELNKKISLC